MMCDATRIWILMVAKRLHRYPMSFAFSGRRMRTENGLECCTWLRVLETLHCIYIYICLVPLSVESGHEGAVICFLSVFFSTFGGTGVVLLRFSLDTLWGYGGHERKLI